MKKLTLFASALLLATASFGQMTWALDKSHTKLGFTTTHLMMSETSGEFKNYDVKLSSKAEDFVDATLDVTVDVNSVNTNEDKRDAHLKSPDFFDAAKYPTITYKSKTFKKVDGKKYKVTGDLTMHGVTKPVDLDVTLIGVGDHPFNKKRVAGFKFTTTVKRADFTLGSATPGAIIGDEINIFGSMEFFKN